SSAEPPRWEPATALLPKAGAEISTMAPTLPQYSIHATDTAYRPWRWLLVPVFCLLSACAALSLPQPQPTFAAPRAEKGPLALYGARLEESLSPGESGFWLLDNNTDALLVRIALADLAVE